MKKSVDLVVTQYTNGAVDFNRVFNVLATLVNQQNTLAATQGQIPSALIDVYKALGGGWQIRYGGAIGPPPLMVVEELPFQPGVPAPSAGTLPPVPTDEL